MPIYVRALAMSIFTAVCWFFNFLLCITFPPFVHAFTNVGTFCCKLRFPSLQLDSTWNCSLEKPLTFGNRLRRMVRCRLLLYPVFRP